MLEYLSIWDLLSEVALQPDVDDSHIWRFSTLGTYSEKSAYEELFVGGHAV